MIDASPQKSLVTASSSAASPLSQAAAIATPADLGITTTQASSILGHSTLPLVYRQFEQQAAQQPHKTAIQFEGQLLSYGELNRRANQLAHYLVSLGAGPDILIAVCVERSLELMVTLLAIHKAGSAYLPLDLGYPSDRIQYILDNAQAPLLICHGHPNLPSGQAQIVDLADLADLHNPLEQYPSDNLSPSPKGDDLAYVIYTSGSTGNPKGVQIEHRSLSNLIQSMAQEPGLNADDVTLAITTICFDISVLELFMPLTVGATMILASRAMASDGAQLGQMLEQHSITWAQGTPSTWRMLIASGWQGNRKLKVLSGGEATTRDLADGLLARCGELWNVYGPTETTIWSMVHPIEPGSDPVPLGHAIANTQVYLMECLANGELYPVMPGEPGEICIGGWGVARGYLNRPELNREKFVADLSSREIGARLYRTGDLAQELPDGKLQFLGRIDHQVKIRGHRVELGEIEAVLLKHPEVQNAAVIATTDSTGSQALVSYLVAQPQPQPEAGGSIESAASGDTASGGSLADDSLVSDSLASDSAIVEQWTALWDDAYRHAAPETDPTFDFSGYGDSYTGDLLPAEVVEEWTEQTVNRILALKPRRVLEVGCGKGLLLFRVAPHCDRYVGVDVTPAAIAHLQGYLARSPQDWSQVSLAQAAAHELEQLACLQGETFDTVVINSVVQYFPDVDYLLTAIESLTQRLSPGGRIFLGDLRHAQLVETFHTSVQTYQLQAQSTLAPDRLPTPAAFQQQVEQRCQQEVELLFAPPFFAHLQARNPRITQVVTQLKRGWYRSELTDFRYDLVLHLDKPSEVPLSPSWITWTEAVTPDYIKQYLAHHQPDCWAIRDIPNRRIAQSQRQLEQLRSNPTALASLTQLWTDSSSGASLEPETVWSLSQDLPYRVHLRWSQPGNPGKFDAIFQAAATEQEKENWANPRLAEVWDPALDYREQCYQPDRSPAASQPAHQKPTLSLATILPLLQQHLPSYMIPSKFVLLETLPLTPNGKVDRKALPSHPTDCLSLDSSEAIAPATPTEQQLAVLWEGILHLSPISRDTNFFEAGGHSLRAAQLISQIGQRFSVELPLSTLFQRSSLQELAAAIDEQLNPSLGTSSAPGDSRQTQIEADLALGDGLQLPAELLPVNAEAKHILVTGATGFVGGFLVQELLRQTQANLYCLVRSPNRAEAQRKLENHLEQCQVPWESDRDRLIAIPGDLAQPHLGLTAEQYQTFQGQIDAIYHNGAYVNLIYPYSELRAANVNSTLDILRLASQVKLKPVHYVSTLDVLHSEALPKDQLLSEDQSLPPAASLNSDYARSKWVAEQLIQTARSRGIPCNIYRLGMTTGHSRHGFSNADDMIGRLIRGLVDLTTAPEDDFPLNLAPVDVVCQAIVALGQQTVASQDHGQGNSQGCGQTFHVSNPRRITLGDLIQRLQAQGYEITPVAYDQWFSQLMATDESNALRPLLGDPTNPAAAQGQDFFKVLDLSQVATDHVAAALPSLQWPDLQPEILDRYLSYFLGNGILVAPKSAMARDEAPWEVSLP